MGFRAGRQRGFHRSLSLYRRPVGQVRRLHAGLPVARLIRPGTRCSRGGRSCRPALAKTDTRNGRSRHSRRPRQRVLSGTPASSPTAPYYLNAYVYTARRDRSAACVGSRSGARWCGPRSGSGRGRAASQTARLTAAEVARPVTPPAFAAEVRVRGGGAARRPGVASSAPKWRRSPASLRKCPGGQRLRRPAAPAPEPIPSPPEERRCPRRPPGQRREPKPPASSPPKFARRLWPARRAARAAAGPDRGGRAQDRHAPGGLPAQRAVQPASRRYRAPGGRRLRGNARCSGPMSASTA